MDVHLLDFLGDRPGLLWVGLLILLLALNLVAPQRLLTGLAVGAAAGAVVGIVAPQHWGWSLIATLVVSVIAGVVATRSPTREASERV